MTIARMSIAMTARRLPFAVVGLCCSLAVASAVLLLGCDAPRPAAAAVAPCTCAEVETAPDAVAVVGEDAGSADADGDGAAAAGGSETKTDEVAGSDASSTFDCTPALDPATGAVAGKWVWKSLAGGPYALVGAVTCSAGGYFRGIIPGLVATNTGAWVLSTVAVNPNQYSRKTHPLTWREGRDFGRFVLVVRHMEPLAASTKPIGACNGDPCWPMVKPGATEVLYSPVPLVHGASFDSQMLGGTTYALNAGPGMVDAVVVNLSAALHLTWKSGSQVSVVAAPDHPMAGQEDWATENSMNKYPAQSSPVSRLVQVGGQPTLFVLHRYPTAGPYAVHAWQVTAAGFGAHQVVLPQVATAVSEDLLVASRSPGQLWLALADSALKGAPKEALDACDGDYVTPQCGYAVKLFSATASGATWLADFLIPRSPYLEMRKSIQLVPLDGEHLAIVGAGTQVFVWSAKQGLTAGGTLFSGAGLALSAEAGPFAVVLRPANRVLVLSELPIPASFSGQIFATGIDPAQGVQWSTKLPMTVGGVPGYGGATATVRADGHSFVYAETAFAEIDEHGNLSQDPLCFGPKAPNCDDGDPCTLDACDSNGKCKHAAKADGSMCAMAPPKFCLSAVCGL